jgi:beta-N-acetylhexosaminidase
MDPLRKLALGRILASFAGPEVPAWVRHLGEDGLGGVVLFADNVVDDAQVRGLADALHSAGAGFIVATDEEGGDVTRLEARTGSSYPGAAALGAVDDVEATRRVMASLGARLRAAGIDLDLAPCADVNSDPANPVIGVRSFGSDPALVARHVAASVAGLQGAGVAACLKHFPGHGDTSVDSHLDLPRVDVGADVLEQRELVPFRAGIAAGAAAVMTSHVLVPALDDRPATTSHRILVDLLRTELGFSGSVITDALDMAGISRVVGIPTAAVRALAAGADLLCLGARKDEPLVDAVVEAIVAGLRSGDLAEDRLEAAAARTTAVLAVDGQRGGERAAEMLEIARRAITIDGAALRPARHAVVVTCHPPIGIAAGDVPWGVAQPLLALDPMATALDLHEPQADRDALAKIVVDAQGRPLVLVVRDAHRHEWQRRVVHELLAARPDLVVVEMGWPADTSPPQQPATRITTHGASRASGEAVARMIFEGCAS